MPGPVFRLYTKQAPREYVCVCSACLAALFGGAALFEGDVDGDPIHRADVERLLPSGVEDPCHACPRDEEGEATEE